MPDAQRPVVLHMGAHKTASTHLQQGLKRAGDRLRAEGLRVFLPDDLRRDGLRLQDWLGRPDDDRDHAEALRAAFAGPGVRLLLSEENVPGMVPGAELARDPRLYPQAGARLARLAGLLPPGPVVLALAVREAAGFLASCHAQALMAGRVAPFAQVFGGLDPVRPFWDDLAGRLLAAVPGARLVVWDHADWPAVAPQVLAELLGSAGQGVTLPQGVSHPGLSAPAVARLLADAPADPAAARALARELRADLGKAQGHPAYDPWGPEVRAGVRVAHAADLARLAARPGVRLLRGP